MVPYASINPTRAQINFKLVRKVGNKVTTVKQFYPLSSLIIIQQVLGYTMADETVFIRTKMFRISRAKACSLILRTIASFRKSARRQLLYLSKVWKFIFAG